MTFGHPQVQVSLSSSCLPWQLFVVHFTAQFTLSHCLPGGNAGIGFGHPHAHVSALKTCGDLHAWLTVQQKLMLSSKTDLITYLEDIRTRIR